MDNRQLNNNISLTQYAINCLVLVCVFWQLLIRLSSLSSPFPIPEEEGVLVLKESNFDEALKAYPNLLVLFYAPRCAPCKELAPEYAKAAGMLKAQGSDIHLGKVDLTTEEKLSVELHSDVPMIPTIVFFKGGDKESYSEYHGRRQAYNIVKWLKKRTSPAVNTLVDVAQAESMVANEMAVIGFFKDAESEDVKVFHKAAEGAAEGTDDIPFGITSDDEVYSRFEVSKDGVVVFKNGVVLFKKFDEGRNIFDGELTKDNLLDFIKTNKQTVPRIFSGEVKSHPFMWSHPFMSLPEEEGVLVLKESNFDKALKAYPNLLVLFYNPLCDPCKELAPEYAKAARMLKAQGSDIHLGKVDLKKEWELRRELRSNPLVPTMVFFKGGDKESYSKYIGYRQAYEIVMWLKENARGPVETLVDVEEAEFLAGSVTGVIGFFKDAESEDVKFFVKAAEGAEEGWFGITSDDEVYSRFEVSKDGVVVFKRGVVLSKMFDEGRNHFDELTKDKLIDFINANDQ